MSLDNDTDSIAARRGTELPRLEKAKATPTQVLAIVCVATCLANLDLFVVNVGLLNIASDFRGASLEDLSWVLNGYAIAYAALLVFFGRLLKRLAVAQHSRDKHSAAHRTIQESRHGSTQEVQHAERTVANPFGDPEEDIRTQLRRANLRTWTVIHGSR